MGKPIKLEMSPGRLYARAVFDDAAGDPCEVVAFIGLDSELPSCFVRCVDGSSDDEPMFDADLLARLAAAMADYANGPRAKPGYA